MTMKHASFNKAIKPGICMRTTRSICKEAITPAAYSKWTNCSFIAVIIKLKYVVSGIDD